MTKDAESSRGIAEGTRDFMRGAAFDIKRAQGFVIGAVWAAWVPGRTAAGLLVLLVRSTLLLNAVIYHVLCQQIF